MKIVRKNVQAKQRRKGGALVEYALLIAGVALIGAASVSVFGHKTSDLVSATAAVIPGAHADDNGPITSGKLIETTAPGASGSGDGIELDVVTIEGNTNTGRLGNNVLGTDPTGDGFGGLVLEP